MRRAGRLGRYKVRSSGSMRVVGDIFMQWKAQVSVGTASAVSGKD